MKWQGYKCGLQLITRFFYDLTSWLSFLTSCDQGSNPSQILLRLTLWTSVIKIEPHMWPLMCSQCFFYYLTYWPTFRPHVIKTGDWRQKLWPSLKKIGDKNVASVMFRKCFLWLKFWSFHLDSYLHDPDRILNEISLKKQNTLTKSYEDWTKHVASIIFTSFFHDLT